MALVVQKFGGSSVATAERIQVAAKRAIAAKKAGNDVMVVVSARGDTTDDLIELSREVSDKASPREMDMLLSTGEQISIALLAMAIQTMGEKAVSLTGPQVGIVTNETHSKARIRRIATAKLKASIEAGNIVIVAGFQGMDEAGEITTLGRGGSDTTAVALAAAMKHDAQGQFLNTQCEIYTDVDGVYTTDPRIVSEARKVPSISYEELLELTSLGAGVMHSRSIEFASKFGVPFQVRNSFNEKTGTWVLPKADWTDKTPVCGVALVREEARVRLAGLPDQPGVGHAIFAALSDRNIAVDMIAQAQGRSNKTEIGFTLLRGDLLQALDALKPLVDEWGANVTYIDGVSKVSIVGSGMRTHTGVAATMFTALAGENINIRLITTSEIKITVLVDRRDGVIALRTVHNAFGLDRLALPPDIKQLPSGSSTGEGQHLARIGKLTEMEEIYISDIALDASQGYITIFDLPDQPGLCGQIFSAIALSGVVVDMIVQSSDDSGVCEISFTVPTKDIPRALEQTQFMVQKLKSNSRVVSISMISKVTVYGIGIRTYTRVIEQIFGALAKKNININMLSTSETCVSMVVDQTRGAEALETLKATFGVS